jgi:hypothetical protein
MERSATDHANQRREITVEHIDVLAGCDPAPALDQHSATP